MSNEIIIDDNKQSEELKELAQKITQE